MNRKKLLAIICILLLVMAILQRASYVRLQKQNQETVTLYQQKINSNFIYLLSHTDSFEPLADTLTKLSAERDVNNYILIQDKQVWLKQLFQQMYGESYTRQATVTGNPNLNGLQSNLGRRSPKQRRSCGQWIIRWVN